MKRLLSAAVVLMCTPALAGPFEGVYVTDLQGCKWFEEDGAIALFDHDFMALTIKDGIYANEYHCDFLDRKTTHDNAAMVITAFCEYPGEPYPDLFSLREFDEHSITVTSLHDAAQNPQGGSQIYKKCNNLKELPVD